MIFENGDTRVKNSLISVIIPVYNVEEYLSKCVESVINQTYKDIEILLVDDGSTDNSGELCNAFANSDNRIHVIHKSNGGLSDARNAALDIMTGDYVTFIDSDDYVTSDYIEYLYTLLIKYNADVSMCNLKRIYSEKDKLSLEKEKITLMDGLSAMENYLYQGCVTPTAWCKLYKRRIFDGLRYPFGYYEDMATICSVLERTSTIVVSNLQKYFYIQRKDSIMGEVFNSKKMHKLDIAYTIHDYISSNYPQMNRAAETRCFMTALQLYREVPWKRDYADFNDAIWHSVVKYRHNTLRNPKAKKLHRLMALSTFTGKKCTKVFGIFYSKTKMVLKLNW